MTNLFVYCRDAAYPRLEVKDNQNFAIAAPSSPKPSRFCASATTSGYFRIDASTFSRRTSIPREEGVYNETLYSLRLLFCNFRCRQLLVEDDSATTTSSLCQVPFISAARIGMRNSILSVPPGTNARATTKQESNCNPVGTSNSWQPSTTCFCGKTDESAATTPKVESGRHPSM